MRAKQIFTAGILVAVTLLASGCQKLKARDDLNRGVQAFKATQYSVAVERFKEATDLDPYHRDDFFVAGDRAARRPGDRGSDRKSVV